MTAPATVRQLEHGDAHAWSALRLEALQREPLSFGSSVPDDPGTLADRFLERLMPRADAAIFGAFDASSMIGIVGLRRHDGAKERHIALIWGMYVTARARRCGAGQLLMEHAIASARRWSGVEQVQLSVTDAAPDAMRLYERCGFLAWGTQPRALLWAGRHVDEVHMALDLRDARHSP